MSIKSILKISAIVLAVSGFTSCTTTTTKTKPAVFNISNDSIARDVNSILLNEEINVHGVETNTNGRVSSELTVSVINPKRLPQDTAEQNGICEQVAVVFKAMLKDKSQFDAIKVLLVQRVKEGAVTNTSYYGRIFKTEELKTYRFMSSIGNQYDSATSKAFGKTSFSRTDDKIISVFRYYNATPGHQISMQVVKRTDSVNLGLLNKVLGKTKASNEKWVSNLPVEIFYEEKEMGSGNYTIRYLISDTVVCTNQFTVYE